LHATKRIFVSSRDQLLKALKAEGSHLKIELPRVLSEEKTTSSFRARGQIVECRMARFSSLRPTPQLSLDNHTFGIRTALIDGMESHQVAILHGHD